MLDMKEAYYIVKAPISGVYQIRLTFNHECISTAHSLEEALERIKTLAERYGTEENLMTKWRQSDLRSTNKEHNKMMYEKYGDQYKTEIDKIFEAEKPKIMIKKHKKLLKTPINNEVITEEAKLEEVPSPSISLKPKKRILFR